MTTGRINQGKFVVCGFKENIRHYGNDDVFSFYDVQKLHMVDFSGIQGTLDIVVKWRQSASNFSHRSPQKKTTSHTTPKLTRLHPPQKKTSHNPEADSPQFPAEDNTHTHTPRKLLASIPRRHTHPGS